MASTGHRTRTEPATAGLFDGVDATRIALDPVRTDPSPTVTHLTYAVRAR
jgi:hypothetical protein